MEKKYMVHDSVVWHTMRSTAIYSRIIYCTLCIITLLSSCTFYAQENNATEQVKQVKKEKTQKNNVANTLPENSSTVDTEPKTTAESVAPDITDAAFTNAEENTQSDAEITEDTVTPSTLEAPEDAIAQSNIAESDTPESTKTLTDTTDTELTAEDSIAPSADMISTETQPIEPAQDIGTPVPDAPQSDLETAADVEAAQLIEDEPEPTEITFDLPPGVERICIEAQKIYSITKESQDSNEEDAVEEYEVPSGTTVVKQFEEPDIYEDFEETEDIRLDL